MKTAPKGEGMLDAVEDAPATTEPATEPAPEAKEAAPAAEADQGKPEAGKRKPDPANSEQRPDGYVPRQALEQARIEAREEVKREKEARERTEQRFQQFLDRFYGEQTPQRGPADDIPDPQYDPNAYLAWDREQKVQQRLQAQQQEQQSRAWTEAYTAVQADFNASKAEDPALEGAYDALRASLAAELNMAYGLTGPALQRQLEETEMQHVMYAHQNRIPIGRYIRGLAQARGWQPQAAQAGQGQPPAPQPGADTGQTRDPATGQFTGRAPADIAQSQERNVSLSQAPGAPVKKMTAKELAQMDESAMWDHFRNVTRRPGGKQFDRDMGYF